MPLTVTVPDGSFKAYVARPDARIAPVVVVLQEIFGVNVDLRATCDELAQAGFIAVAPDLFWRAESGLDLNAWSQEEWRRGLALYQDYDFDRGVKDIAATIAAARVLDGANGKVGVTGFCMGGLLTYLTAARTDVDAAASYYGGSTEDYLGEAPAIVAPMIFHLAQEDEFMSKDAQDSIHQAVAEKANIEIFSYPGCSHAFARHNGDHYDAEATRLAHARTKSFLTRSLMSGLLADTWAKPG